MKNKRKNNKGFSLIELIISIAILAVLSGLLIPQMIKYVEKSRETRDMQLVETIYLAVNTALTDEEAYEAFAANLGAGNRYDGIDNGISIGIIAQSAGDAFQREVASILGEEGSALELKSKRLVGKDIFVQITTADTGFYKMDIGVYAGMRGTPVEDFIVGRVADGTEEETE